MREGRSRHRRETHRGMQEHFDSGCFPALELELTAAGN